MQNTVKVDFLEVWGQVTKGLFIQEIVSENGERSLLFGVKITIMVVGIKSMICLAKFFV